MGRENEKDKFYWSVFDYMEDLCVDELEGYCWSAYDLFEEGSMHKNFYLVGIAPIKSATGEKGIGAESSFRFGGGRPGNGGATGSFEITLYDKVAEVLGWGTLPFDEYGVSAQQFYAECTLDPDISAADRSVCWVGGFFSSLWTPQTSEITAATLTAGYALRVAGPFRVQGVPKRLRRIRKFIRFDPPHHGKGYHIDGELVKILKRIRWR